MRIVVLGATSRTGLCLLAEAQRRGHQIVAFTRRPQALTGTDAAISLLPGGNRRDPHLAAGTARALIAAMIDAGVKRLVVVSAYPIVADRPRLPIWILRRLLATPYADVSEMEQIISTSDLDWTIARLNRLTSKPPTGATTTSTSLLAEPRPLTRADAASILLDLAENTTPAQTAINVSGA